MSHIKKFAVKGYMACLSLIKGISPRTWAKIEYYRVYKTACDLDCPRTFSEKLLWLWLNDYRSEKIMRLNDKYDVREYIASHGEGALLNELYFVTDDPEEISYERLPDSFALKVSQGVANNLLCPDKSRLTESELKKYISEWSKGQYLYDKSCADLAGIKVKELPKHYICERYLSDKNGNPPADYKFYCFDGKPVAILCISDRFGGDKKGCFMDLNWELIEDLSKKMNRYSPLDHLPEKPACLPEMIRAAEKLSEEFPFVRVDLYDVDGKPVFGEMTFFISGCIGMSETEIDGKKMGELLRLRIDE